MNGPNRRRIIYTMYIVCMFFYELFQHNTKMHQFFHIRKIIIKTGFTTLSFYNEAVFFIKSESNHFLPMFLFFDIWVLILNPPGSIIYI